MTKDTIVNNQNVTDMLQKMLQLGDSFVVDINKQVHYVTSPDEPILIPSKNEKIDRKLYVYDVNIKDPEAIILNPLAETMTDGVEKLFFYAALSNIVSQWLYRILLFIVEESVNQKGEPKETNTKLVPILAPFISKVDEKMVEELEKIKAAGHKDFCNIYYNRMKKTSALIMGLEDESGTYIKSFGSSKIRKKTWTVITDIVKNILKVPEDKKIKEVYSCSTEKVECPQFTTFSDVWIRMWECLDPYLDWFENHHSDPETIESLKNHIKHAPVYRECVMWLKQPTANKFVAPGTSKTTEPQSQNAVTQTQEPSWKLPARPGSYIQVSQVKQERNVPSWATSSQSRFGYGSRGTMIQTRRW